MPPETKNPPRRYSAFPKTLAACIEPAVRPALRLQGLAGSRILTDWPSIVGETLAAHCVPLKLAFPPGKKNGGTLTIAAENGFATELQHQQALILERLSVYFGYAAVARLSISHSYPAPPTPEPVAPKARRLPESCRLAAAGVADDELSAALVRMADALT